jgi:Leucine-rich repeat (LRR) protein
MQSQAGDEYIRELASFIRTNERGMAEYGLARRRTQQESSLFSWFSPSPTNAAVLLKTNLHHLFYLLIRLEALHLPVGSLDIHVDAPSRPMSYPNIYPEQKNTDAISFSSLRSSFSVVSSFSLGGRWWSQNQPPDIDAELKYIYSCFTKVPALRIGPPSQKVIHELLHDPPDQNAVPLDAFKNLQYLECEDIDPRALLGWDRLAESLRSLKIRNSGLQDISDIFIAAVLDDQARRQGSASRSRHRNIPHTILEQPSDHEENNDPPPSSTTTPSLSKLSPLKWTFLKHLYLPDNGLTFFPPELIPYLKSLTHLDLTSNLLVSVPAGLGELYNLVSLNLTDNLIDSVLGIYQNLGQILYINLAHNRLDSLCGLERLLALERIDLRYNLLEDSAEIGRLAILPNICELWVEGNPFVDIEERYRIKCFDYFWKEGKCITLDGASPTLLERRNLSVQEWTSVPPFLSSSAPVISVEPFLAAPLPRQESSSTSTSPQLSPLSAPNVSAGRKKKQKRVVDLNGNTIAESLPQSPVHSRTPSETKPTDSRCTTTPGNDAIKVDEPTPSAPSSPIMPDLITTVKRPRRSRHSRYQTEYESSKNEPTRGQVDFPTGAATLSSRSDIRRARVSASVFERPNSGHWKPFGIVDDNAASYRQKIEVLKRDMGDNWLKVYNQGA